MFAFKLVAAVVFLASFSGAASNPAPVASGSDGMSLDVGDSCACCCEYYAGYGSIHHECASTADACTQDPFHGKCVDRSNC